MCKIPLIHIHMVHYTDQICCSDIRFLLLCAWLNFTFDRAIHLGFVFILIEKWTVSLQRLYRLRRNFFSAWEKYYFSIFFSQNFINVPHSFLQTVFVTYCIGFQGRAWQGGGRNFRGWWRNGGCDLWRKETLPFHSMQVCWEGNLYGVD